MMEANLDRSELIAKQSADELMGEALLQAEYSINNEQKNKSRSGFRNLNESIVLDRPMTPAHLRQSVMLQTKPFEPSDFNRLELNQSTTLKSKTNRSQIIDRKNSFKLSTSRNELETNNTKKSANILVINSNDMQESDIYSKPPPSNSTKIFSPNDPTAGFASRPKIQRTPEQSLAMKQNDKSINASASIQSNSSLNFTPKYSITEPRPSSVSSSKSSKSPSQSNASNATLKLN